MKDLILDTHAIVWYLMESPKLSRKGLNAIDNAEKIYISAISIIEIIYLEEKGKIPKICLAMIEQILNDDNNHWKVIPCDFNIAKCLSQIDREIIPEMPDRIIAATALYLNLPLITCDTKITASTVQTIW
ncbi:MAG: PIN domain-containing protein [Cyanobacterium sp. T60_A2020_053]|nr:PIN domain-containing protein [Cyanobacterium sp. T60_A2020_053]